ncbi:MAG: DUF883 family protein [Sulfuriferula sp.]
MSTKNLQENAIAYDASKDQLISHLKTAMADAEALIRASANQGGEALSAVRTKAEESVAIAKDKMTEIEAVLSARSRAVVTATDVYVHENPWQALSISAGLGLIIGFLISRR